MATARHKIIGPWLTITGALAGGTLMTGYARSVSQLPPVIALAVQRRPS